MDGDSFDKIFYGDSYSDAEPELESDENREDPISYLDDLFMDFINCCNLHDEEAAIRWFCDEIYPLQKLSDDTYQYGYGIALCVGNFLLADKIHELSSGISTECEKINALEYFVCYNLTKGFERFIKHYPQFSIPESFKERFTPALLEIFEENRF